MRRDAIIAYQCRNIHDSLVLPLRNHMQEPVIPHCGSHKRRGIRIRRAAEFRETQPSHTIQLLDNESLHKSASDKIDTWYKWMGIRETDSLNAGNDGELVVSREVMRTDI
jgi:hypothetical protein